MGSNSWPEKGMARGRRTGRSAHGPPKLSLCNRLQHLRLACSRPAGSRGWTERPTRSRRPHQSRQASRARFVRLRPRGDPWPKKTSPRPRPNTVWATPPIAPPRHGPPLRI